MIGMGNTSLNLEWGLLSSNLIQRLKQIRKNIKTQKPTEAA